MSELEMVGIDLGKHTFHLHGQDVSGREMFRKKLSRVQMMRFSGNCPTRIVVMDACAGSHFVAHELATIGQSLVRDRTNTINQLHGFLLEFGISLPLGRTVIKRLPSILAEHELPIRLSTLLQRLHPHFGYLDEQITQLDKQMAGQLAIEMGDGKQFGCGRDFAASIGLVPRQYSTGGRSNLKGDQQARRQEPQMSVGTMRQGLYAKAR